MMGVRWRVAGAGQVGAIIAFSRALAWEKVPEGRMRAPCVTPLNASGFGMAYTKPQSVDRARALRKNDTAAERKLWEKLRGRRLSDVKFVRQLPVGPYFADFACRERKLIVEVDGATHSTDVELQHDRMRTLAMEAAGFRVLRFWNDAVYTNIGGVIETILLALGEL